MRITNEELIQIIKEELEAVIDEKKGKKRKAAKKKRRKRKKRKKAKKKDACYHKVKSRYDVWPSAYASGALVKCRSVGAKNWGNSKKEGLRESDNQTPEQQLQKLLKRIKGNDYQEYAQFASMVEYPLEEMSETFGIVKVQELFDANVSDINIIFKDADHQAKFEDETLRKAGLERISARGGHYSMNRGMSKKDDKRYQKGGKFYLKTFPSITFNSDSYHENREIEEEFKRHDMYDPKTGEKFVAKKEQDHKDMAAKGYVHVDPDKLRGILDDEGGAAGLDPMVKGTKSSEEEVEKALSKMPDVGKHEKGDYIKSDKKRIRIVKEKKNCGCGQTPCKSYGK